MNRIPCFLVCVTIGLCCTGCWPLRVTTSPGTSGMVMDARTYAAISGAQVVVCRSDFLGDRSLSAADTLKKARPPRVTTKANGRFSIPSEHRWVIYFPSPTMMPATGKLVVTQEGYEPVVLPLIADPKGAGGSSKFLVGDIVNLPSLTAKLKTRSDPVSDWLMEKFPENARTAVAQYPESGMDGGLMQSILVRELNAVIVGPVIYETNRFREVTISASARLLMKHESGLAALQMDEETYRQVYRDATTPMQVRAFLNRQLLEDAYPGVFSAKMGDGYYRNVGVVLLKPEVPAISH